MKVTKDIPDRWCKAYLSETRKQEAKKRKSDRDRRLFLAAEVLLNRSIQEIPMENHTFFHRQNFM